MDNIIKELEKIGIVPVIVIDKAEDAVPLAKALIEGGLPAAEVTFRTAAAEEAIRLIAEEFPEMAVGAGTVLTTEQADRAVKAGAKFIVSPGLNPEVVKHCQAMGVPMLPGCANPSDVETALSLGLTEVKFFPAEQLGGLDMIKAMAAPYTDVRFMPTGGLNAKNMRSYLREPKIIACGGSFMVRKDLIAKGDFETIKKMTAEAVGLMLEMTFRETVAENGRTLNVFETANAERAVYHLERRGMRFDREGAELKDGRPVCIDSDTGIRLIEKR
ncbi:MAG: bifunctional 4-hydroxy-2-oxoglutarate aldolase/2-dehydro-3-deoxy-phosphogluconate aldolase [Ruminococcus sp.]|nr:bifunctional 4-hydroxy-2-oxoglutarate aldolase/2-dehydro-3-deoxy-phosphogluconate aldolase [Ruminococcus sp.]